MEIRAHRDKWRIKANVDESTGGNHPRRVAAMQVIAWSTSVLHLRNFASSSAK